ncbi:hypothetical protein, conserved [Cyanidioschyzon merolae strain 10D]|jgi:hypothetical protein|uniref:Histone H1 n=1 Tax=Cyanidioschyzon merolae (strain NIES-3377 / 10D) TaxID=280699 RepID=M1VJD1_CYAM1|nr:hypothetical protein, conserved [Cyanidioschyzon merolae strain 10D]BAM81398.1 hypothetical protein, conserved [Cyanidioschyzon merolae strain 10D]|eukprot:XP_005537434.1 hypothetical protein, conserved [Cyanidioschyzon merolae strain 10D]
MVGNNTEAGMAKFLELKAAFEDVYEDTTKFFEKGNKAAAVRARKKLLRLREIAQEMRVLIQQTKAQLEQEHKTARTSGGGGGLGADNQVSMGE